MQYTYSYPSFWNECQHGFVLYKSPLAGPNWGVWLGVTVLLEKAKEGEKGEAKVNHEDVCICSEWQMG